MGVVFHFIIFCYISSLFYTCTSEVLITAKHDHDLLWCSHCGVAVGDTLYLFNKLSPGAIKVENRTAFSKNVTVQTLINPFLFMFDVVTVKQANCADLGRHSRGDSWFPGYSWRICTCPSCASQLGWTFERTLSNDVVDTNQNETFHALIVASLFEKNSHQKVNNLSSILVEEFFITKKMQPMATEATATSVNETSTLMSLLQPRASEDTPASPTNIATTTTNDTTSIVTVEKDKLIITTPANISSPADEVTTITTN